MTVTRDQALKILDELKNSPNMVKHALACEAAMRALARKLITQNGGGASLLRSAELKAVEDNWGIVGLLHDADYEAADKSEERHTEVVTEKLQAAGCDQEIIDAVRGHADKALRDTSMAKAIYAADELTGLIVATALVMPEKKLASVTTESVLKKFKDLSFARGANREMIKSCQSELGISLEEFIAIALGAMQKISVKLGL